jgi:hypothetical protein
MFTHPEETPVPIEDQCPLPPGFEALWALLRAYLPQATAFDASRVEPAGDAA